MIIYFIRHGATAGNLEKRYIGRTDEELCTEGIERLKELQELVPDIKGDSIPAVCLSRCRSCFYVTNEKMHCNSGYIIS